MEGTKDGVGIPKFQAPYVLGTLRCEDPAEKKQTDTDILKNGRGTRHFSEGVREVFAEKCDLEEVKEESWDCLGGRAFKVEGAAAAKVLKWDEHAGV